MDYYQFFNKKPILHSLIIISIVYGIIIYIIRKLNKKETIQSEIKNKKNIDNLLKLVEKKLYSNKNPYNSQHFFYNDLHTDIKEKIDVVDREILHLLGPGYKSIPEITEIYYTSKKEGTNSDLAYHSLHTDGPFHYCDMYRFLICLKPNDNVITIIPEDNYKQKLKKYEILGFDYNNTHHYITHDNNIPQESRILLKIQYTNTEMCDHLVKNFAFYARNLFNVSKEKMYIKGMLMLVSLFISTYLIYFLLLYILIAYFYFKSKKSNNLFLGILSTSIIIAVYKFVFSLMFLFY